ncbi:Hypothetical predicted protein [Octopus vulgaris]|uniref:CWH43-like N-terminal domain-containing protein n=1 Tax=Octopus vulgaris TaxID=6645 RepID=A0AA36FJ19_OCTVU|nr:Hypothetical predicted protein [Octopus vulgaris]
MLPCRKAPRKKSMLRILPILTAAEIFASFLITYIIGVIKKDVDVFLPYISYTSVDEPQKSVFSQSLNIGALLLGFNAYIRFLQVKACYENLSPNENRLNKAGLVLGLISAFGLSMVGNFHARYAKVPHYFGAFLAFAIGSAYCWVQNFLTGKDTSVCIKRVRFVVSVLVSILLVTFIITVIYYKRNKYQGSKYTVHKGVYLTSTCSEWLLALMILIYVGTFFHDFRHVQFKFPTTIYKEADACDHEMNDSEAATGL